MNLRINIPKNNFYLFVDINKLTDDNLSLTNKQLSFILNCESKIKNKTKSFKKDLILNSKYKFSNSFSRSTKTLNSKGIGNLKYNKKTKEVESSWTLHIKGEEYIQISPKLLNEYNLTRAELVILWQLNKLQNNQKLNSLNHLSNIFEQMKKYLLEKYQFKISKTTFFKAINKFKKTNLIEEIEDKTRKSSGPLKSDKKLFWI